METILTLPLVLAVVLVELAVGGTFVTWFLERRGEAPGGFLKLVAGVSAVAAAELVIATTPAGSTDWLAQRLPDRVAGTLFDVVYDPWPTALAAAWRKKGGDVVGGLDLLVHQAALQVALMTGQAVDVPALVPALRAAGERALRAL